MNAIEVVDLSKHYGPVKAVDGISLTVRTGEVFGIIGPNGAGKTTAVECIEGLRQPDSGRVTVLGLSHGAGSAAIKERLGVQLQSAGLFPKLTVRETIALFAAFFPRTLPQLELLELVGLGEKANTATKDLSGGQRQRLNIALALVGDPEIIFLDEPTAAMDPAARRAVWSIVDGLKAKGRTVILTTHYMEEAARLCDRVAVIDHGRVIAEGDPGDLVRTHFPETAIEFSAPRDVPLDRLQRLAAVARVLTEDGNVTLFSTDIPVTVARLLELAQSEGFALDRFTVRSATLEDLFLRLTGRKIRD